MQRLTLSLFVAILLQPDFDVNEQSVWIVLHIKNNMHIQK